MLMNMKFDFLTVTELILSPASFYALRPDE